MPPARRCTATSSPCRCARTRCPSRCRPTASRSSRPSSSATSTTSNFGVPTVSLRYFTVYGPRQRPDMGFNRFFSAVLAGTPVIQYGDGLQTRDFTFVADAARATADAGVRGTPGRVYNIGGGSRVTLLEVFDLIGKVSGRPVIIDKQPPQKGDMRDTYADTTLARADLGFAPTVTLEQGLTAMHQWFLYPMNEPHTSARGGTGWRAARGRLRRRAQRPCRRPAPRPTSSCSSAARRRSRSASGSRRGSTSARSSTTTRRAPTGPTPSWRSATPTSASTRPKR